MNVSGNIINILHNLFVKNQNSIIYLISIEYIVSGKLYGFYKIDLTNLIIDIEVPDNNIDYLSKFEKDIEKYKFEYHQFVNYNLFEIFLR